MTIEELIAGKKDTDSVSLGKSSFPVSALKNLMKDGYQKVKVYEDNNTFSFWGKNCTACFTEKQILDRAKQ
jgi:hypothetical protein